MPHASQTVAFEGDFAEGVWGIFKIIRGFADLRGLAAVSVPYERCLSGKTRRKTTDCPGKAQGLPGSGQVPAKSRRDHASRKKAGRVEKIFERVETAACSQTSSDRDPG